MPMTPIKVRGKRAPAQTESSKHSVSSLLNPCSKGKRPLSPASKSSSPSTKFPRHTNTLGENSGRHARFTAPLEQLPTELLETIFFHDLNISLPQASPFIGSKLATRYVKTQIVLTVFSVGRLSTYPCEQAALFPTVAHHAEAQSAILRLRWMTLPFLRELIPAYITKTLVRELSQRRLQWLGQGPLVTKETEPKIRQYLEENSVRLTKRNNDDAPVFGNVSWRVEHPPRFIRLSFGLHDGFVAIEERLIRGLERTDQYVRSTTAERDQWRIFCGVNGCRIPSKLLHGPWTNGKCDFLEMVVRGNATVDWLGTTSGEIAEKGLIQALREGNPRATRLLVTRTGSGNAQGLWGPPCPSDSHNIEKLEPEPWPRESLIQADGFESRGVGVVPRTKHLIIAVLEAGCQQDVIKTLLMAADTDIDVEDRVLLGWAAEKKFLGDDRGPWLLSMLFADSASTTKERSALSLSSVPYKMLATAN